jgi:hypothetical protein
MMLPRSLGPLFPVSTTAPTVVRITPSDIFNSFCASASVNTPANDNAIVGTREPISPMSKPDTPLDEPAFVAIMPRAGQPGSMDPFDGANIIDYLEDWNSEMNIGTLIPKGPLVSPTIVSRMSKMLSNFCLVISLVIELRYVDPGHRNLRSPCLTDSTAAEDFLGKVRTWMDTIPTKDREWIMAGDLNLTLSRTEASDRTYFKFSVM